jgi:hypothetical protein
MSRPRRARLPLVVALGLAGAVGGACLSAWDVGGPWACSADQTCPQGFSCDDGLCCKPGGSPRCPTLPAPNGGCADGEATVYFEDRDGDGAGNPRVSIARCRAPLTGGWVLRGDDCDDADARIAPGGAELCNGRDDNCDQVIDDGLPRPTTYARDVDGDGFGAAGDEVAACAPPPGRVPVGPVDCQPFDAAKHPGAVEACNGVDDDCDGVPDEAEASFGDTGDTFPCLSGQPGRCAEGTFACRPRAGGGVERVCQPLRAPEREVCNGVDDDCDGAADEQPACLGPSSLSGLAGASYGAKRLTSASTVNIACQRNTAGVTESASPDGATWSGVGLGSNFHLWWVEVPASAAWDLSAPDVKLRLKFAVDAPFSMADGGVWGERALNHPINPVVSLCGESDGEVIRYVPTAVNDLSGNEAGFDGVLQVNNLSGPWVTGRGSGFDTGRVRRLEVLVWKQAGPFTITFDPVSGFFQ